MLHYIMQTIQHIIKCEQDTMTMMNQMFLFLTIRQLWRSIVHNTNVALYNANYTTYNQIRAGYNEDDESNVFIPYYQTALAFHST